MNQLVEIKMNPKVPSTTSISEFLKSFEDRLEVLMLELKNLNSFSTIKQHSKATHSQLRQATHQYNAACQVISRFLKEVSSADEAIATLDPQIEHTTPAVAAPVEDGGVATKPVDAAGLPPDVIVQLDRIATSPINKQRGFQMALAEDVKKYKSLALHPVPDVNSRSKHDILSMDVHPDSSQILIGGSDGYAKVFDKDTREIIAAFEGHSETVTKVLYHPELKSALTASKDSTIRIWDISTSSQTAIIRAHDAAVTGLSLHPTGEYVLSTSLDEHLALSAIRVGRLLTKVADSDGKPPTTAQFHPNGLIFGTGNKDSEIKIWDLREKSIVANLSRDIKDKESGEITALSFSANRFHLATAAGDSCIKIWDLRKYKIFRKIKLNGNSAWPADKAYAVNDLCFDQSGNILAVAGSDVRVYLCEEKEILKCFNDFSEALAIGVRFGTQTVASVSNNGTFQICGLKE